MSEPRFRGEELHALQRKSFDYFVHESNPVNGLVRDKNEAGSPATIAAVGLGLAAYPVGVQRGFLGRHEAVERVLATLRFFSHSVQGTAADATGYRGFYYHFLDMKTGKRAWQSELSTIDSAYLLAGMLTAAAYFDRENDQEHEIRTLSEDMFLRADWDWARNGAATLTHGWKPESGFLSSRWQGYNEGLILYVLGMGSPSHPLPRESYAAWCSSYSWRKIYGHELLHSGPLFTHQLSHLWIDFRGIQDDYMRGQCLDYFQNSRRAAYAQQKYAIENPNQFKGYGAKQWGITASSGPGPDTLRVDGKEQKFFGYAARGIPDGPDDGTIAPWAVVASLPFAPEIVLPTLQHFDELNLRAANPYGYKATFNQTYSASPDGAAGWVSPWHYGLNQGPVVLMIENYRSGLVWRLLRHCPHVVRGLLRAGFQGGWLTSRESSPICLEVGAAGSGMAVSRT
jgi:hypothetical protein